MHIQSILNNIKQTKANAKQHMLAWKLGGIDGIVASIMLATRNSASYLNLTLASLIGNCLPLEAWEAIIIDQACQDDTPALLDAYEQRLPLVRLRSEVHCPHAALLNEATVVAKGRILVFLTDDRLVAPDFLLQHLLLHLQKECVVIGDDHRCIHTHLFAPDEPAQQGIPPQPLLTPADLDNPQQMATLTFSGETNYAPLFTYFEQQKQSPPFPWACFSLANASVPKKAVERVGGFDTGLDFGLEAADLAYRLHRAGVPFRFAPKAITLRQLRPNKPGNPRDLAQNLTRFFCKHPHLSEMEREILRRGRYAPTA
jgi:GT2 family glycosyltransferase